MLIAIFKSQNEAMKVYNLLKRRDIPSEVISTPRKFLRSGSCSYCLKFNSNDIDKVRQAAKETGIQINAIYRL